MQVELGRQSLLRLAGQACRNCAFINSQGYGAAVCHKARCSNTSASETETSTSGQQPELNSAPTKREWSAAWPWVEPGRAQILPMSLPAKRPPVRLENALKELQDSAPSTSHSVDIAVRFNLDPRRSDQLVRGSVVLPYGLGKSVTVVVFAKGADADLARQLGADIGDEELITDIINRGADAIKFDKLIATPDFMKALAKAGKVLGPKGLMPNPKMGTLTTDIAHALKEIQQGRLDYRLGKDAVVRASVGKVGMPADHLLANLGGLFHSLIENRPKTVPGVALAGYVKKVVLRTSQSPAVHIDERSCEQAVPRFAAARATSV